MATTTALHLHNVDCGARARWLTNPIFVRLFGGNGGTREYMCGEFNLTALHLHTYLLKTPHHKLTRVHELRFLRSLHREVNINK